MQYFPLPNIDDLREALASLLALAFCWLILFTGIALNNAFGGGRKK